MPISTTWVSPAGGGVLDLATGSILTETWCDGVASDLLRLGGVTGAVTQNGFAAGTTSDPTTTATGFVDMAEMSVSLTTTGGDVLAFLIGTFQSTSLGSEIQIAMTMDAGPEVGANRIGITVANTPITAVAMYKFAAPSVATHVFKGRWLTTAGTATARDGRRGLLMIELKR